MSAPIRPATVDDSEAIARVHVDTWRAAYRGPITDEVLDGLSAARRAEGWRGQLAGGGAGVFVAVLREDVVGFASAGPARDEGQGGELYAIYVRRERWGAGIGGRLLAAVVEHLRSLEVRHAMLWVLETNDRTRRFYERHGWSADGGIKTERFGPTEVREVRYRLDLSRAPHSAVVSPGSRRNHR